MRLPSTPSTVLALWATLLLPRLAAAQDQPVADPPADEPTAPPAEAAAGPDLPEVAAEGFPIAFYDRPLTIADSMIRVDGELVLSHDLRLLEGSDPTTGAHLFAGFSLGAAFGITDDVEVGLSGYRMVGHRPRAYGDLGGTSQGAVPLVFNPDVDFGDLRVYGKARVIRDPSFELALEASVAVPIDSWFALSAGAPLRARLSPRFLIDASLELLLEFGRPNLYTTVPDDEENSISMLVPVRGVLQLVPALWIAGQSGFDFYDFDFDRFAMPLSLEVGTTVHDGAAPLLDVVLGFHFPYFFSPRRDDKLPSELWQITLGLNGYFQL